MEDRRLHHSRLPHGNPNHHETSRPADHINHTNNVQQFWDTWDINTRAFYRAKAALMAQGRFKGKYKQVFSFDLPS
jgi:hypothetical protein